MGKHYVPQRYLQGFKDKSTADEIWMYDKKEQVYKRVRIRNVAQSPDFYTQEVENLLTRAIENPGNAAMDKIKAGAQLDEQDRAALTSYIGTTIRRVPRARKNAYERTIPTALADTIARARENLRAEAEAGNLDAQQLQDTMAEVDRVEAKFREEPPSEVVELVSTPWPFESTLTAIYSMNWRLFRAEGPNFFLTSDNPAYFFDGCGLGSKDVELTFPVCTELALHLSWAPDPHTGIGVAHDRIVKEFNRRLAYGADRFIFYHQSANWILDVAKSTYDQLKRIGW
jgi:hypothetical protein